MSKMILVAESGSDITPEMAQENGIVIVPMHVSFGGKTYDLSLIHICETLHGTKPLSFCVTNQMGGCDAGRMSVSPFFRQNA